MSIYKKLLEIQKHCKGLAKDASGGNYTYVSGNKLLSYIRTKMDDVGVILKQEVLELSNERIDYKTRNGERSEMMTKVMMRFTWIDCETGESDVNLFAANGMNDWEKGLGSALTYAERYFIMKYFHIATDEDDVDNPNRGQRDQTPQQPAKKQKGVFSLAKLEADKRVDGLLQWLLDNEDVAVLEGKTWSLLRQLETLYIVDSHGEDFKKLINLYELKKK